MNHTCGWWLASDFRSGDDGPVRGPIANGRVAPFIPKSAATTTQRLAKFHCPEGPKQLAHVPGYYRLTTQEYLPRCGVPRQQDVGFDNTQQTKNGGDKKELPKLGAERPTHCCVLRVYGCLPKDAGSSSAVPKFLLGFLGA